MEESCGCELGWMGAEKEALQQYLAVIVNKKFKWLYSKNPKSGHVRFSNGQK